jgi:hypothetical protein
VETVPPPACHRRTAGQGGAVADVKQPNEPNHPPAEPDDIDAGDDDLPDESQRHPSHSQPTPSYDEYKDERAATGGTQHGTSRNARASGGTDDSGHRPDLPRSQPAPGSDPELYARTHRGADYRRYRGTPHGFRAEPGPAARVGEPIPARSDATVAQDVRDFLLRDGLLDLETLDVRVQDGRVELHGRTRTGRGSYQAAELAQHVAGVRQVTNCLEVTEPGPDQPPAGAQSEHDS